MAKKVLIVEDNEDTRGFMKFLVESYGYQVVEAADGIEALESFKTQHPDIILMDVSLPFVDGLTTARAIRGIDVAGNIPIIVVTALGKSYYDQAIEAGCNDLLCKPLDFDLLEPLIEKYLKPEDNSKN